jgi:hypothetical protein
MMNPAEHDAAEVRDSGPRSVLGRLADLCVCAPIGFAFEARHLVPELAERGRAEVRDRARSARNEIESALRGLGLVPAANAPEAPMADVSPIFTQAPPRPEPAPVDDGIDPDSLAIPGYDSLSASQVVPRLAGLDDDELELVRRYEAGRRGRKTILSRIAQLQEP